MRHYVLFVHREVLREVQLLRAAWARMQRHERRRVVTHVGLVAWLGESFAHEWHAIGQADLAFLVLAVVTELESFLRGEE